MKSKLLLPTLDIERIDVTVGLATDVDADYAEQEADIDAYGRVIQLRTQLGVFNFFAHDWVIGELVGGEPDLTKFIEAAKRHRERVAAMRPRRNLPR